MKTDLRCFISDFVIYTHFSFYLIIYFCHVIIVKRFAEDDILQKILKSWLAHAN